jgi:hypothetical protein
LLAVSASLFAAKPKPQRDWKKGRLASQIGSSHAIDSDGCAPGNPVGTACYTFIVQFVGFRSKANVTAHGSIRYAAEKGNRFYVLDEENNEFKMTLLEKTLHQ